jgi:predicted phage gp36 major capsid-like protein
MLKRDLILRMIEELARVVASVAALRRRGAAPEAAEEVEDAARTLLGVDLGLAAALDPAALARQMADPVRVATLARLVHERAAVARDAGEPLPAAAWARRAVELWLEAGAAGAELDDEALAAIAAVPAESLGGRQKKLREALG